MLTRLHRRALGRGIANTGEADLRGGRLCGPLRGQQGGERKRQGYADCRAHPYEHHSFRCTHQRDRRNLQERPGLVTCPRAPERSSVVRPLTSFDVFRAATDATLPTGGLSDAFALECVPDV